MSRWATKAQKFAVGLLTKPYMWVTKFREISLRISFVSIVVVMAFIIDGRHPEEVRQRHVRRMNTFKSSR